MNTREQLMDNETLISLRSKAIELTVQYYLDRPLVSEDVFMGHLERVYNFLLTGNT